MSDLIKFLAKFSHTLVQHHSVDIARRYCGIFVETTLRSGTVQECQQNIHQRKRTRSYNNPEREFQRCLSFATESAFQFIFCEDVVSDLLVIQPSEQTDAKKHEKDYNNKSNHNNNYDNNYNNKNNNKYSLIYCTS